MPDAFEMRQQTPGSFSSEMWWSGLPDDQAAAQEVLNAFKVMRARFLATQ